MDREFLSHYEAELSYLRQMGMEFAKAYPKVAGRLTLDQIPCPDPYVERLLEGFAFLTARIQLKLDSHFPRLSQALLEAVCPGYIAPTPSMLIAQFHPDPTEKGLVKGFVIPRGTSMRSLIAPGDPTACEYRTAHATTLWPLTVLEAGYHIRDLNLLALPEIAHIKAAIRIRLVCNPGITWDKIKMDRLAIFLGGAPETQSSLYEQIFAHGSSVIIQPVVNPATRQTVLPPTAISRVGFSDDEALLPVTSRGFAGYRLLQEYSILPQRFFFFSVSGLQSAVGRITDSQLDLVIPLTDADSRLESTVSSANFMLHCTPAINLFPKVCDRLPVSDQFSEFHVIADRTKTRDLEIFQIAQVTGYGVRTEQQEVFHPFYNVSDVGRRAGGAYYTASRRPRVLSEAERRTGSRSQYAGSEVFVSLVDARCAPYSTDLKQLGIEALCTNRDLPLFIPVGKGPTDFTLQIGAPVKSVRCVGGVPSAPRNALATGETSWRLISHLSLNYLSLINAGEHEGAAALRAILELYCDPADASYRKQIEGIHGITCRPIMRRLDSSIPPAFVRGMEIAVHLEERAFEGTGAFVMGAVLEQFFARYTGLNSFTETVVHTVERGRIMQWKARPGHRRII